LLTSTFMDFANCLGDGSLTAKQKTTALSRWLLANTDDADSLVAFAKKATDVDKATCLEAFEYATRTAAEVGSKRVFEFAAASLADYAPRVKWEAAKLVANIAHRHGKHLGKAIPGLLGNAAHEGTVVRWSAARALGEIIKLGTSHNAELIPAADALCSKERDNAIRNHYLKALKKVAKAR
jgi:HEAT repeat protein